MPNLSIPLTGLLPGEGAWSPATTGESGALVFANAAGSRYAKVVASADADLLAAERDRVAWLEGSGISGPHVLDWRVTEHGACLITSAVAGVPADDLNATELALAWPSITDALVQLHRIPLDLCPFDRTLDDMMPLARAAVAENRVNAEFLPQHLVDAPPRSILDSIEAELEMRTAQERDEAVVCHGDFCLPNILIDPNSLLITGFIDLGRLGRADRYADIALLLANARETWPGEDAARRADQDFASRYGIALDHDRLDFYLRLDPLTW